jgi:hypothetical protein
MPLSSEFASGSSCPSVKNPVLPHGASSKEKAMLAIHPLPLERAPALPGGASWLFHVEEGWWNESAGIYDQQNRSRG